MRLRILLAVILTLYKTFLRPALQKMVADTANDVDDIVLAVADYVFGLSSTVPGGPSGEIALGSAKTLYSAMLRDYLLRLVNSTTTPFDNWALGLADSLLYDSTLAGEKVLDFQPLRE